MNFQKADLAIARYNEDLSWVNGNYDNVFVYNKGQDNIKENFKIKKLKNVGREAESYLQHIVSNYYNLNNITIFSQGNIQDHFYNQNYLFKLYLDAQIYGYSLNKDFYPEWIEPFGGYKNFKLDKHGENLYQSKYTLHEWKKKFNISDDENKFRWYQKAIFAISKEFILTRSLDFYKNLLEDPDLNNINPEVAHFYERSWVKIFNIE